MKSVEANVNKYVQPNVSIHIHSWTRRRSMAHWICTRSSLQSFVSSISILRTMSRRGESGPKVTLAARRPHLIFLWRRFQFHLFLKTHCICGLECMSGVRSLVTFKRCLDWVVFYRSTPRYQWYVLACTLFISYISRLSCLLQLNSEISGMCSMSARGICHEWTFFSVHWSVLMKPVEANVNKYVQPNVRIHIYSWIQRRSMTHWICTRSSLQSLVSNISILRTMSRRGESDPKVTLAARRPHFFYYSTWS
jgi:hypothetical protein